MSLLALCFHPLVRLLCDTRMDVLSPASPYISYIENSILSRILLLYPWGSTVPYLGLDKRKKTLNAAPSGYCSRIALSMLFSSCTG